MFAHIAINDFESRTGISLNDLSPVWRPDAKIVSLRDIADITGVQAMPIDYLERLLASVGLEGDPSARPYRDCCVKLLRLDPENLRVGQTFVERGKYRALLESFPNFFGDFCLTRGIAKITANIVSGRLADGTFGLAHYLPPIVEEHGGEYCLLDGTHRNYLIRAAGTTIESIVIRDVRAPFPCQPQKWSSVRPVEAKPPREERYIGLDRSLFRDVKSIGIDG